METKKRKRVLLVEDDRTSALLLIGMLKTMPVDFVHVETFAEAEDLISKSTFDMVLLDLGLPDSYLSETARRWLDLVQHTPTLIVTAHDEDRLKNSASAPNVVGIMHKGSLRPDGMFEVLLENVLGGDKEDSIFGRIAGAFDDMIVESRR